MKISLYDGHCYAHFIINAISLRFSSQTWLSLSTVLAPKRYPDWTAWLRLPKSILQRHIIRSRNPCLAFIVATRSYECPYGTLESANVDAAHICSDAECGLEQMRHELHNA